MITQKVLNIIVPFAEHGGMDTLAETLIPVWEKTSQMKIKKINIPANYGNDAIKLLNKNYEDSVVALSISQLLNNISGIFKYNLIRDMIPLGRACQDTSVLVTSKKSRFKSIKDLEIYSQTGTIKFGGLKGFDETVCKLLKTKAKLNFYFEVFDSAKMAKDALIRGEVDVINDEPLTIFSAKEGKTLTPLLVLAEEKATVFEHIPTSKQLDIQIFVGPWRGIFVSKSMSKQTQELLQNSLKEALHSQEWQIFIKDNLLDIKPGWLNSVDFRKHLNSEYIELSL